MIERVFAFEILDHCGVGLFTNRGTDVFLAQKRLDFLKNHVVFLNCLLIGSDGVELRGRLLDEGSD